MPGFKSWASVNTEQHTQQKTPAENVTTHAKRYALHANSSTHCVQMRLLSHCHKPLSNGPSEPQRVLNGCAKQDDRYGGHLVELVRVIAVFHLSMWHCLGWFNTSILTD